MDLDLASVQRSRHFQPNGLSAAHDAAMSRSTNQLTQLKPHAGVSCATAQQVGLWLIVPCLSPHYQIPHRNDCQPSLNQVVLDRLPLLSLPYVNMPSRYFLMAGINPGNLRDYSPSHTIKKNMPCQVRRITTFHQTDNCALWCLVDNIQPEITLRYLIRSLSDVSLLRTRRGEEEKGN